jgi:hypothetical protein
MSLAPKKTSSRRPRRTAFGLLVGAGLVGLGVAPVQTGCATQTTTVSTRALERSGRASFVCLDDPRQGTAAIHPLDDCNASTVLGIRDYTHADIDGGVIKPEPHLYALVTQTTRGEVAVIDTTSANNSVLDQDPTVPGANFLPIGAQPVDIVSTRGGTATFVGVAEIGREGLFALPSTRIRPASTDGTGGAGGGSPNDPKSLPEISAWPSCRLPAAPGQMLLIPDPAGMASPNDKASTRPCCEAAYGAAATDAACKTSSGSPASTGQNGDIDAEGKGRQKLVVAIPSMGGVAILDAQTLLDSAPGQYAPCNVERWVPLATDVPVLPPPPPAGGLNCVDPKVETAILPKTPDSRPTTLAYAAGRLYASDLDTSLIHVIDLPTPCDPVEVRPLLPTSLDDPKRAVTTSHVAVAPTLTPDLKRYLYAVDALDGSAMVFDVSDDQASQFPLRRPHPEWNPFTASDRIHFSAPASDLIIVQRDIPEIDPSTGVATEGVRCDPDPTKSCIVTNQTCDIGAAYRTDPATYAAGAGPNKLRGTFAFLALTSGRVAVVDIDDLDAACRGPAATSSLFGCAGPDQTNLQTSKELSCNVVLPNAPRMGQYWAADQAAGLHQAGIQGYPQLFDINGAPIDDTDPIAPRLLAPLPAGHPPKFQLSVGGTPINLDPTLGSAKGPGDPSISPVVADPTLATKSALAMNLEDPRAQLVDQNWFVVYEGALPGFTSALAGFQFPVVADPKAAFAILKDANSRFCDGGVQSQAAAKEKYGATTDVADYVAITTELPEQDNLYWTSTKKDEGGKELVCTFNDCRSLFGSVDVPDAGRNYTILEAHQDQLSVIPRSPKKFTDHPVIGANKLPQDWRDDTKCCFPSLVSFDVRVGREWEVAGDQSGFLHHVIADPATGVCRDSCDPAQARRNGRALRRPSGKVADADITDGGKYVFENPMFRLVVRDPLQVDPVVGQQFRFTTQGAFKPLQVSLSPDGTTLIQPVGLSFISATGQLAVTDGSVNGLLIVDLSSSAVVHTFF